jgi:DNA polymerase III alpha subunit
MTYPILPIFRSHYSLSESLLTLEEPGKAKAGNPLSVFDLATQGGLEEVVVVDTRIDGFIQAYKASLKAKVKLCYGLKLTICADMGDRTPESRRTESRVVVLVKDSAGYSDLIKIWNRSWGHDGSFTHRGETYGRMDWKGLKGLWTEHLGLALPYFSSFIAKNTLTMSQITPDLPIQPWLFREVDSGLPFAPLIDSALERYTEGNQSMVVPSKTILYPNSSWFKAYQVFRAIHEHGSWDSPEVDHLASDRFSFENWKALIAAPGNPP